jgi:hypothetical protein
VGLPRFKVKPFWVGGYGKKRELLKMGGKKYL